MIADSTYTIFLIRESDINIDYELLLSAMKIVHEVKELAGRFGPQEDPEEIT